MNQFKKYMDEEKDFENYYNIDEYYFYNLKKDLLEKYEQLFKLIYSNDTSIEERVYKINERLFLSNYIKIILLHHKIDEDDFYNKYVKAMQDKYELEYNLTNKDRKANKKGVNKI